MRPNDTTNDIPYGYCHCGCGQKTTIAKRNDTKAGMIKGEPRRFIQNHYGRKSVSPPNPGGLCMCGCGQPAPISKRNNATFGHVAGQPTRFIVGHYGRIRPMRPVEDRFWEKVDKRGPDECWEWQHSTQGFGYGQFSIRQQNYKAHRFSWELCYGPIPDGLHCLHTCDNPLCVNPKHLFLGTRLDNINDMLDKGRGAPPPKQQGEDVGTAKLTEQDVRQIRQRFADGESRFSLAEAFGVDHTNIWMIIKRKTWRHVE